MNNLKEELYKIYKQCLVVIYIDLISKGYSKEEIKAVVNYILKGSEE